MRVPSGSASTAAAIAIAPGKSDAPKFDRTAFDVDFGAVFGGEQVRRTVVLNASARGEAEFSLSIQNAPGFAIAEVRVMGQGASASAVSKTQAPMPSGGGRTVADSAVRSVASRASSPPWKVQFNGPAELQIDLLYAPTVDLFNNLIGKKMGVLNGAVRNTAGGEGASIALRADFRGLKEVNAASLKPRERPVYFVAGAGPSPFSVDFDVASIGVPIDGVLRQAADMQGFKLFDAPVKLGSGNSAVVTIKGQFQSSYPANEPDGRVRSVPVKMEWSGGTSQTSVDLVPLPSRKVFQTPMMKDCGISETHALFSYAISEGKPQATVQLTLRSNDPLRTAHVFVEARVAGQRICSVYNSIYSAKMVQARFNDVCSARIEDYAQIAAGPIEYRCVSMSCVGPTPEMCDAAARDRQAHPERWRR